MAVAGGGVSGYVERNILPAFFGQVALTPPATVYAGVSTVAPVDISNYGPGVSYGASRVIDVLSPFSVNMAGAWVIAGGSTGTVLSNTLNTITLTAPWTGGTPSTGTQYDVILFSEPPGNGYARVAIANNTTNFVAFPNVFLGTSLSGAMVTSGAAVNFSAASGAGWGLIVAGFVADSPTLNQGHILYAQPLSTPQYVLGGQTLSLPIGTLNVGLG